MDSFHQWRRGSEFFTGLDRFKGGLIGCGLKNKDVVEEKWYCNSSISLTAFSYTERLKFILANGALYQQKGALLQDFEGGPPAGQPATAFHPLWLFSSLSLSFSCKSILLVHKLKWFLQVGIWTERLVNGPKGYGT